MHSCGRSCLAGQRHVCQSFAVPHCNVHTTGKWCCATRGRTVRVAARKGFGNVKPKPSKKAEPEVQVPLEETTQQMKAASRMYSSSAQLARRIGPIAVVDTENGRGIVTTRPVITGDLLIVSEPIAAVSGPPGDIPSFAQLQQQLLSKRFTDGAVAWINQLYNGENDSTLQHLDLSTFPSISTGTPAHANPLSVEATMRMASQNAIAEETQDIAASAARNTDLTSLLGIWPEAALLNHSCLPSAVVYALDDRLVIRAAKDLPAGTQITRSYIGIDCLAPLAARREALEQKFGFLCCCERCSLEEELYTQRPQLDAAINTALQYVEAEGQPLLAMVTERMEDYATNHDLQAQVKAFVERTEQHLRSILELMDRFGVAQKQRRWLAGSLLPLYTFLINFSRVKDIVMRASAGPKPTRRQLQQLQDLQVEQWQLSQQTVVALEAVAPGCPPHMQSVCLLVSLATALFGQDSPQYKEAAEAAVGAHYARYGRVDPRTLETLAVLQMGASGIDMVGVDAGEGELGSSITAAAEGEVADDYDEVAGGEDEDEEVTEEFLQDLLAKLKAGELPDEPPQQQQQQQEEEEELEPQQDLNVLLAEARRDGSLDELKHTDPVMYEYFGQLQALAEQRGILDLNAAAVLFDELVESGQWDPSAGGGQVVDVEAVVVQPAAAVPAGDDVLLEPAAAAAAAADVVDVEALVVEPAATGVVSEPAAPAVRAAAPSGIEAVAEEVVVVGATTAAAAAAATDVGSDPAAVQAVPIEAMEPAAAAAEPQVMPAEAAPSAATAAPLPPPSAAAAAAAAATPLTADEARASGVVGSTRRSRSRRSGGGFASSSEAASSRPSSSRNKRDKAAAATDAPTRSTMPGGTPLTTTKAAATAPPPPEAAAAAAAAAEPPSPPSSPSSTPSAAAASSHQHSSQASAGSASAQWGSEAAQAAIDAEYDAFITMMAEKMADMDEAEGEGAAAAADVAAAAAAAGDTGADAASGEGAGAGDVLGDEALQELLGMSEADLEALLDKELQGLGLELSEEIERMSRQ